MIKKISRSTDLTMGVQLLVLPLSSCAPGKLFNCSVPQRMARNIFISLSAAPHPQQVEHISFVLLFLQVYIISSTYSRHGPEGNYIQRNCILLCLNRKQNSEFAAGKLKLSQASGPWVNQACIAVLKSCPIISILPEPSGRGPSSKDVTQYAQRGPCAWDIRSVHRVCQTALDTFSVHMTV